MADEIMEELFDGLLSKQLSAIEVRSALKAYATQAVEAYKAGLIEKWENYHANEAEGEAFTVGYFTRMEEEDAYKAQQQGEAVPCLVGIKGSAFDLPSAKRAYTYAEQPGNVVASKLGKASRAAATRPGGDSIDAGLSLLSALQIEGFGVFALGAECTARPAPAHKPLFAEMIAQHPGLREELRAIESAHNIGAKP